MITPDQQPDDAGEGCVSQSTVPPTPVPIITQESAKKQTSFLAILSAIITILSLLFIILWLISASHVFFFFDEFLLLPGVVLGLIAFIQITFSKGRMTGKGLALLGMLLSLILMIIVPPIQSVGDVKAKEATLHDNLQMLRSAIQSFKSDTGVYPAALADLVAANGAVVTGAIKAADYQGPYLIPNTGINGTGIPKNPFTSSSDTIISDHWKYNPKTGKVTVPDSQAGMTTVDDGTSFKDL